MAAAFRRALATGAAMALLCGCTMQVHKVEMDSTRLVGSEQAKVACAYRQGAVLDARPSTGRAGGLGKHLFLVADATELVRGRLAKAGISAAGEGQAVDVRLLHLYISQNQVTKVPVLVVSANVAAQPAFTLRSQQASMNWNNSEAEAYRSYSAVFDDVMLQLVSQLNARCPKA